MKFEDLNLAGTYTYVHYFSWQFEERVELIDGRVFTMAIESNRIHQKLAGYVHIRLGNFLEHKTCDDLK